MKDALLHTKLQRPVVAPDFVMRDRLLAKLEQGRHRPLTLISASAGFGKSTLASYWATSCDCRYGWVSLDEDDNDLHLFLLYLLAAVQQAFPKVHMRTETLLEADTLPSVTELARYLLNDLDQLPEPFILILDDYHRIDGASAHDFMAALLAHPARTMHLVLLTRRQPPLPIAALRGSGMVTEIGTSDLQFTIDEVAAFMSRILGTTLDDATVATLEAKTEGWALGLRLAGLYLQGENDPGKRSRELSGSSRHIAEYYFAEVLLRRHPEMVTYLLDTAILDRFCAPLCSYMHPNQEHSRTERSADEFIKWLWGNNLFVIALDDEGYWFRYHHLFRDFLNGMLRKQSSKERIEGLQRLAGKWFAENQLIEEAIRHLLAAGDSPEALQLVLSHRHTLMNASRFARLSRWLAAFPEDTLAQEPLLLTTKALIAVDLGKNIDLHAFTDKAARMLAGLSPTSDRYLELKGEVLVLQSVVEVVRGDIRSALSHVQEAFDCLPENDLMARTVGIFSLSVCHQMTGNSKQAAAIIGDAVSDPFLPANIKARMQVCLCYVYYLDADLGGVATASHECLRTIRDLPFLHTRAYANYFHGAILYMQNKLEPAKSYLQKVLEDPYSANPTYLANSGFVMACIYLSHGRESEAVQVLEQLKAHCRENRHARATDLIRAFEGEFALRRGDIRTANQICRNLDFNINQPRWFFYVPQLTRIKYLLAEGTKENLKEAQARLVEWDDQMRRVKRTNVRIEVLALLAVLHQKIGDETVATESLRTALDLAESSGWVRTFVDAGPPVESILMRLSRNRPSHTFTRDVLEACRRESIKKAFTEPGEEMKAERARKAPDNLLTRRETEILTLLTGGLSNKEIAERLSISAGTVKTHLKNTFKKLNVSNRMGAVNTARELGLLRLR